MASSFEAEENKNPIAKESIAVKDKAEENVAIKNLHQEESFEEKPEAERQEEFFEEKPEGKSDISSNYPQKPLAASRIGRTPGSNKLPPDT